MMIFFFCSKTKKIIIIGSLIFIAVVIVALAISLPITLKNHADEKNNHSSNTMTTSSGLFNATSTAGMHILYFKLLICLLNFSYERTNTRSKYKYSTR